MSGKGTPGYKAAGFRSTKKRERDVTGGGKRGRGNMIPRVVLSMGNRKE